MDYREIKLDCCLRDGLWTVYDERSGDVVATSPDDSEYAWMYAAERLAKVISEIRRDTQIGIEVK